MRKLFAPLACLAVLASCVPLGAPARPAEPSKTDTSLVTNLGMEPDTIDPQEVGFTYEASIVGMLYEPLLTWDPTSLALVPAAARSLPDVSADGRVYTYTLRDALTYSDGTPLTAQRFADAFLRLCDPNLNAMYAFLAYPIEGCQRWNTMDPKRASAGDLEAARGAVRVRALDDLRLEFTLTAPNTAFTQATALWVGAPVRTEDIGDVTTNGFTRKGLTRFVGNGPFVLSEWRHNDRMVFVRNERYRLPVRLARWTKVMIGEPAVARSAYDHGELDVLSPTVATADDREAILARPDLVRTVGNCTTGFAFNTARPPFDDANVRLAFAKALDKEDYATNVARVGRAAASLVPHGEPGHAHDDRVQQFDPAEARRLLAASKYGAPVGGRIGGIPISFTFTTGKDTPPWVSWSITQWYANLGVVVTPDPRYTWMTGPLVKKPEQVPQLQRFAWCGDYPDGQGWYTTVFQSASAVTHTGFHDATFDSVVARADVERDPSARERLYEAASYELSREAPAAWLMWTEQWLLVRPGVRGYAVSSLDWDFSQFALARIVGVRR